MQRSPVRRSPRLHSEDLTQVPQNTGDIAKVTEACNKTTETSASTIMMNPTVSAAVAEASIANASQSPTAAAVTTTIPFRTPAVPDDIRSVVHCTYTSSQASGPCNIATPTAASRVLPILASAPTTINAAEESMIFLMQRQIANLELQLKHAQARITESEHQRQRLEPSAITSYASPYSRPLDARDFAVANNASSTLSHNGHVVTRHNGTSGMQSYIGTIANSLNGLQYTAPPINMQSHMHMASANPSSSVISPTITPHSAYSQATSNTPQSVIQPPRKLMDLPEFSGQPEDWPVFYTAYTESTIAYNYSNFENNQRLNKCLKGSARESVKSLLIHPNNVGAIVEQLRVRFGRPEQLVRSQLKAVRDMPFVSEAAIGKIVPYATATKNLTVFLQSIGEEKHLVNPTLLEELVNKLPLSKRLEWARYSATIQPYPTIINFSDWLSEIASFVQMVQDSECREPRRRAVLHTNGERSIKCIMCHGLHKVSECKKFSDATVAERWEQSKRRRLCFSCLNAGHATRDCRHRKQCMVHGCQRHHHRLLHEGNASPVELVGPDSSSGSTAVLSCSAQASRRLLFRVVPVTLYGPSKRVNSYALLDEGSSITMMDKSLLEELGLHGHTREVDIQWFGGNAVKEQVAVVNLYISGVGMKKRHFLRNVHGVDKLDLPMQSLNESDIRNATRYRDRIPVTPYENVVPKMLIGLDHCHLGLPTKTMPSNHNGPYAAFTDLGCVVFGPCSISPRVSPTCLHISNAFDHQIHNMVAEYFSIESFGVKAAPPVKSAADQRAKRILEETTVKVDGRFQTGLLWRCDNIKLPESYNMALQRLVGIERKIERNKNFGKEYRNIVKTYINKKYARKLEPHEVVKCNERTWYLPHFAVANPRKPGKLRLVFDAAATTDGVSLNSQLLKGPQQYRPLVSVLFHFREGAFAVCADIQEMYHQVLIRPEDRCAQRFLWRDAERGKAPEVYEMTAMTFGAACSPCAAHYVKVKNALEHRSHDPRAIRAITEYHYVDDYVDSFDSETQAIQIAQQVRDIHKDAGFNLRKFTSNSTKVAEALGGVKRALPILSKEGAEFEKVLGMLWQPPDDSFAYQLEFYRVDSSVIEGKRIPTKRELLSIVMSIFDPLGFLSHFTISAKLVLRELWKRSIGWDEPVPNEVNAMWCVFRKQLLKVVECRVPRHYFQMGPSRELQLHVFVDASENAFSAAAYWRSENMNRIIEVSLVYAKTRSAPIKPLTIPRLELQAAVLGTRMMTTIISEHSVRANRCVMWSDSKTVLKWLFSKHRRYKPFVAHRIAEILDVTKPSDWRWVPTNQNVADEATRPNKAINLSPSSRWFTGPEFLYNNEQLWPKDADVADEAEDDEEEIRTKFAFIVVSSNVLNFNRFSSFTRLRRVVAWVIRFLHYCRRRIDSSQTNGLTAAELAEADYLLCRLVQRESYARELKQIESGNSLPSDNRLCTLSPFIDDRGILRVYSRLDAVSWLPYESRCPIILPQNHSVTKLIVAHEHIRMIHQNIEATICEIRRKYWVPNLRRVLRGIIASCNTCVLKNAKPVPPMMGLLPEDRTTPYVRPFTFTGLDYFGPVSITIGRRTEKRWVALFTCLSIRAIHLEVAYDLSTDACILAMRNFMNRRGVPKRIRTDNGKNFVGVAGEVARFVDVFDCQTLQAELSTKGVEWVFNCPENPSEGGVWERMVQCVKKVLRHTLKDLAPKEHTFQSLLIEAENIVNSRPLTHLPITPQQEEPLTPNHFLLGCANTAQTTSCSEPPVKLCAIRKQWRIARQLRDRFWKRWVDEYLPTLTRRTKWCMPTKPLGIGDLVLICDPKLPRREWRRGRVLRVFPGKDGEIRRAEVTTITGLTYRPVSKLAVLDLVNGESDSIHGGGGVAN